MLGGDSLSESVSFSLKSDKSIVAAAIVAQEEERRRIAREMHDGPAQALAGMVFRVEIIQKLMEFDKPRANEELERLKEALRASLNDVRKIIYDLRPLIIEQDGLASALEGHLRSWQDKSGVFARLEWSVPRSGRFSYEVETTLYRLVQEALTNVAKHAEASEVIVSVGRTPSCYTLLITDDGKGFDVAKQLESSPNKAKFGLSGMRERVQLLGGSMTIDSKTGAGTKVRVELPA